MGTLLEHLLMKVREANDGGLGTLSTGEALAAALVLNRADWLTSMGYTIAEALDRVDDEMIALIPSAARMFREANVVMAEAQAVAREEAAMSELGRGEELVDLNAKLVTYGNAPGYRDVSLVFDVQRFESSKTYQVRLHVNAEDSISVMRHIAEVNRTAWDGGRPIDSKEDEVRPRWLNFLYSANRA